MPVVKTITMDVMVDASELEDIEGIDDMSMAKKNLYRPANREEGGS